MSLKLPQSAFELFSTHSGAGTNFAMSTAETLGQHLRSFNRNHLQTLCLNVRKRSRNRLTPWPEAREDFFRCQGRIKRRQVEYGNPFFSLAKLERQLPRQGHS